MKLTRALLLLLVLVMTGALWTVAGTASGPPAPETREAVFHVA